MRILSILIVTYFAVAACKQKEQGNKLNVLEPIKSAEAYTVSGDAKYDHQDFDGAVNDYTKAIELNPISHIKFVAFHNRGMVKSQIFMELDTMSVEVYVQKIGPRRGKEIIAEDLYRVTNDYYEGAMADYNMAIQIEPHGWTYFYRGQLKHSGHDDAGAVADYTKAIDIKDIKGAQLAEVYSRRGKTKNVLMDHQGAVIDYTRAIEVEPDKVQRAELYSRRGDVKKALMDYTGALDDYAKAVETEPTNIEKIGRLYWGRGFSKYSRKDYQGAIGDFTKAIEIEPNSGLFHFYRGISRIELGQKGSGCLDLSKAGELGYKAAYEAIQKYCQ